jgi:hypothetical protein
MFKIIGADQKEYGPISVEQIRRWVSDGRLNAQSKAQREGSTDWQSLSAFDEFADIFQVATPTPAATPFSVPAAAIAPDADATALTAVKGPAIALTVVSSLGVLLYLASSLVHFISPGGQPYRMPANVPTEYLSIAQSLRGPVGGLITLVAAALNGFVLFGCLNMMRLQSFNLAIATCIVAMLPCQCCCLLGLPFGIWGLIVLNKPEVKSQFLS